MANVLSYTRHHYQHLLSPLTNRCIEYGHNQIESQTIFIWIVCNSRNEIQMEKKYFQSLCFDDLSTFFFHTCFAVHFFFFYSLFHWLNYYYTVFFAACTEIFMRVLCVWREWVRKSIFMWNAIWKESAQFFLFFLFCCIYKLMNRWNCIAMESIFISVLWHSYNGVADMNDFAIDACLICLKQNRACVCASIDFENTEMFTSMMS